MKKIAATFIFNFCICFIYAGGQNETVINYIDKYKWIAVEQMHAYHIPASITLAQGIIESGAGLSELAKESNNHFGIKCHDNWKGDKVYYDDDAKDECFRKYENVEDSYKDHSEFLVNGKRYASLFDLKITDYKSWAKGLKAAGYATNPQYADMLIDIIELYALNDYDEMSLADVKKGHTENTKKEESKNKNQNNKESKKEKTHFSWGGYSDEVFYHNRIPTIVIEAGDTPESIAKENNARVNALLKYNDMSSSEKLEAGKNFYLQPKRKKGKEKYHIVKTGETVWNISRDEGVLLHEIYKKNKLLEGQEPAVGETLNLRRTRKNAPKLQTANNKNMQEENEKDIEEIQGWIIEEEEPEIIITKKDTTESKIKEINTAEKDNSVIQKVEIKAEPIYHEVQPQETLYALSKKYSVRVEDIKVWNQLSGNEIKIGQKLIVGYN